MCRYTVGFGEVPPHGQEERNSDEEGRKGQTRRVRTETQERTADILIMWVGCSTEPSSI